MQIRLKSKLWIKKGICGFYKSLELYHQPNEFSEPLRQDLVLPPKLQQEHWVKSSNRWRKKETKYFQDSDNTVEKSYWGQTINYKSIDNNRIGAKSESDSREHQIRENCNRQCIEPSKPGCEGVHIIVKDCSRAKPVTVSKKDESWWPWLLTDFPVFTYR